MSIIRAPRKNQFYTLPTAIIEDDRLSWEARGLLVYLLSKPDHWKVNVRDLINRTKNAIGKSSGRDKVYSLIKELRFAGYLCRVFLRDSGDFVGVKYEVNETPDLEASAQLLQGIEPHTDLPETVAPDTPKPQALVKTEKAVKIEKAENLSLPAQCEPASPVRPELSGCPENYPRKAGAPNTEPWLTYAIAFKARYKHWPIYNAVIAKQLSNVVARIGSNTELTIRYYVERMNHSYIVEHCHPMSTLLRHCEQYAIKAAQSATATQKRNNPPVIRPAPISDSQPSEQSASAKTQNANVVEESREKLANMLGGNFATRLKNKQQSQG